MPGVDLDEDKQAAALVIMRPGAGAQDRQAKACQLGEAAGKAAAAVSPA